MSVCNTSQVNLLWKVLLVLLMNSQRVVIGENKKTVHVMTASSGCAGNCVSGCASYIMVNQKRYSITRPGLHIVTISNKTGRIVHNSSFDDLTMTHKREKLKMFLKAIPASSVVIITAHKQCIANIRGWYEFLRNHSKFVLSAKQTHTNGSSIIITCQNDCPLGSYSTKLPLYKTHGSHTVRGNLSIHFVCDTRKLIYQERPALFEEILTGGITGQKTKDDIVKKKNHDKMEEKLMIIILSVAIGGVLVLISLIIGLICCCKSIQPSRQNKQGSSSATIKSNTRSPSKFENWMRQKQIREINKEITKSKRIERDHREYKGDIVRGSVSTNTISRDFHMLSSDYAYENVFDDSVSVSTNSLRSCIQNNDYLKPADFLTAPNVIKIYAKHSNYNPSFENTDETSKTENKSGFVTTTIVRTEPRNGDVQSDNDNTKIPNVYTAIYPGTSRKIFLSPPNFHPSAVSLVDGESDKDGVNHDDKQIFADYCKINTNGPVYKKPSNVIKHSPPEKRPTEIPRALPRKDSMDNRDVNTDYENAVCGAIHVDNKTVTPDYEELTEHYTQQHYKCLSDDVITDS